MKRLLLTGASGFLGKNIKPILEKVYLVDTIGRTPDNMIVADLSAEKPKLSEKYDMVLHAAGKAHVTPRSDKERQQFFDVNYQGTINLCEALSESGLPGTFIFISTIAVYGLMEGKQVDEQQPLKGASAYAKSKIMAEAYLQEWCSKHHVNLVILRPPLLIGKDAPGNFGSMLRGIRKGYYLSIGGGNARKSYLMAEDIGRIALLAEGKQGIFNICDDYHPTMRELENAISNKLGKRRPISIPCWMAKVMAIIGDVVGNKVPFNTSKLEKLTYSLTISNEKAKKAFGWEPLHVLNNLKL